MGHVFEEKFRLENPQWDFDNNILGPYTRWLEAKLLEAHKPNTMKAELKPLQGKYYGTKIVVIDDNGVQADVKIWNTSDRTPSKRQLEAYGYTEKQWEENALVDSGWDDSKIPIREIDITCDGHFESKKSYELALKIVQKLNG